MRGEARQMLQGVLDLGRGGTFQSRTERDIVVRTSLARLEQLDVGDEALYFGRIDRVPEPAAPGPGDGNGTGPVARPLLGESFHIGRLAVSGPDHEPLVVDWRAPVAEPFYRATGLDPQGLARRRHLAVRGRRVLGLEDEYFVDPSGRPAAPAPGPDGAAAGDGDASGERLLSDGLVLGGPGALLSALGQARTGQMGDIIGSPLGGILVVQGGPGTGKTAVALHRAAYLLYTHRFPLERQGVLVVGPNPLFLRYIEQVLPSLGETGVTLSTVPGLVPEVRVRGTEPADVARLKGEARMVRVIARAVRTRQRPLRRDVAVPFGAATLRLTAAESADIVGSARRRPGPHNTRRRYVEQQVVRRLADQYRRIRRDLGVPVGASGATIDDHLDLDAPDLDAPDLGGTDLDAPDLGGTADAGSEPATAPLDGTSGTAELVDIGRGRHGGQLTLFGSPTDSDGADGGGGIDDGGGGVDGGDGRRGRLADVVPMPGVFGTDHPVTDGPGEDGLGNGGPGNDGSIAAVPPAEATPEEDF